MSGRHGRSQKGRGRSAQAATQAAAAAAEQARQQLLDAALKVAPKHTYSSDDENDEDFAEFRKQAAQLAGQAQLQPVLPDGLDPGKFATALQQLQQHLGLTQEVASDALLATAEQNWKHYDTWIEEAQIFLAMRQETDIEAQKMAEAMEASIHEREQRRQLEEQSRPELTNLSEERLRKRFAGSPLLDQLSSVVPGPVLFCDRRPLFGVTKCQLVALLRLEESCCKWWPQPGTLQYFKRFAERCASELQSGIATRSSCTQIAALHQAQQQQQQQQEVPQDAAADQESLPTSPAPQQNHPQQEQRQDHVLQQQDQVQQQEPTGQQLLDMPSSLMNPPADPAVGPRATSVESDSRAGEGSQLSTGSAAAADRSNERRQSTRKRQVPERYRSATPPAGLQQQKAKVRRTPPTVSPPAAVGVVSRSSEPPAKQMRLSSAVDVGSRAVSALAAPAGPAEAAAGTSAAAEASSQQLVTSLPMSAAAGCGACCPAAAANGCTRITPCTVAGAAGAVDARLQQQLDHMQQAAEAAGGSCSSSLGSLVYQAAVMQQLSQVLCDEAAALQAMIYSMPPVAGAVPEIFRSDETAAAAADDGSSSDVEITAEHVVPPPGAPLPAAPANTPAANPQQAPLPAAASPAMGNGEAGIAAAAAAAGITAMVAAVVSPPVPESPPDSPPPRFPEYRGSFFTPGDFERSPSVEIISD